MPKGYILCEIEVTDHALYQSEYMTRSTPAVQLFDAKFLIRGGNPQVLEGDRSPKRIVLVEFESPEKAREFYYSEQYQDAAKWRHKAANTHYYILEGAHD